MQIVSRQTARAAARQADKVERNHAMLVKRESRMIAQRIPKQRREALLRPVAYPHSRNP